MLARCDLPMALTKFIVVNSHVANFGYKPSSRSLAPTLDDLCGIVVRLLLVVASGFLLVSCSDDTDSRFGGPPPTIEAVRDSIVRVTGLGCGAPAFGSGFAVDEHLVVTSAHLVTGRDPDSLGVIRPNGDEAAAVLVAFDPDLDLVLLRVDDLSFTPVTLVEGDAGNRGAAMVVRSANEVDEVAFVVDARVNVNWDGVFRDTESRFRGLRLDADINRGDSGSGLFVSGTHVIGLVHSTTRSDDLRGYAVSATEISDLVATVDTAREVVAPRCAP